MDDPSKPDGDDPKDTKNDPADTDIDEGGETPADTDGDGGEPKKDDAAEKSKENQKKAWLAKIKSGAKTLADMPDNLDWLAKDKAFEEFREKGKKASEKTKKKDVKSEVREALKEERDKEDYELLEEDLEQHKNKEKVAQVWEEFAVLRADKVPKLRALITARRLVGLTDSKTVIAERRRKGMFLPPTGSKDRKTVNKEKMTDAEKELGGGLPSGFAPKKK